MRSPSETVRRNVGGGAEASSAPAAASSAKLSLRRFALVAVVALALLVAPLAAAQVVELTAANSEDAPYSATAALSGDADRLSVQFSVPNWTRDHSNDFTLVVWATAQLASNASAEVPHDFLSLTVTRGGRSDEEVHDRMDRKPPLYLTVTPCELQEGVWTASLDARSALNETVNVELLLALDDARLDIGDRNATARSVCCGETKVYFFRTHHARDNLVYDFESKIKVLNGSKPDALMLRKDYCPVNTCDSGFPVHGYRNTRCGYLARSTDVKGRGKTSSISSYNSPRGTYYFSIKASDSSKPTLYRPSFTRGAASPALSLSLALLLLLAVAAMLA